MHRFPKSSPKQGSSRKKMMGKVTHLKNAQEALRKAIQLCQKKANIKVEERSMKFEEGQCLDLLSPEETDKLIQDVLKIREEKKATV